MINEQYSNALAEVLHYLKGVRQEDIDKIPKKFINYVEENASKKYICMFDNTRPLKELNLLKETRGVIGSICLSYWCENDEQRKAFLQMIKDNETNYQEAMRNRYNPNHIFNIVPDTSGVGVMTNETALEPYNKSAFIRIKKLFKFLFFRRKYK